MALLMMTSLPTYSSANNREYKGKTFSDCLQLGLPKPSP